jgi:hypothetical protein
MPALSESVPHQEKLDELIGASLALQKLYGRDVESSGGVINLFQRAFARYPAEKVVRALEIWLERKQEFPTPADIIGLIKRNGKEPVAKEIYIDISKKDPEYRTDEEWVLMKRYRVEQQDELYGCNDEHKEVATLEENLRLRAKVQDLEHEVGKLWKLLQEEREKSRILAADVIAKVERGESLLTPKQHEDVHAKTIALMKENGSTEEDIQAYTAFEANKQNSNHHREST